MIKLNTFNSYKQDMWWQQKINILDLCCTWGYTVTAGQVLLCLSMYKIFYSEEMNKNNNVRTHLAAPPFFTNILYKLERGFLESEGEAEARSLLTSFPVNPPLMAI